MWLSSHQYKNNHHHHHHQWITEEIKEKKFFKYLETKENENTIIQNLSDTENQFFIEGYKLTFGKKKNLKQPNLMHKATRERTNETQR